MRETRKARVDKAVYFDARDYAGPIRRILILGIDMVALAVIAFGLAFGVVVCRPSRTEESAGAILLLLLLAGYVYLTFVQRSRIGTLGYLLMGVRIVDIQGRRPSLLQMTVRLIPMLPVPWSLLFDLGWMLDDPSRQTLAGQMGRHVRHPSESPTARPDDGDLQASVFQRIAVDHPGSRPP